MWFLLSLFHGIFTRTSKLREVIFARRNFANSRKLLLEISQGQSFAKIRFLIVILTLNEDEIVQNV